jgi:hypothetical protein
MLSSIREWASFGRDIGLVLGIPVLIMVGGRLYDLQIKANESQIKANEAQIKSMESQANFLKEAYEERIKTLEAQNATMKETQYDRSLAQIKSQEEIFKRERDQYSQKIIQLEKDGGNNQQIISELQTKLISAERAVSLSASILGIVTSQREAAEAAAEQLAVMTMEYNDKIKAVEHLSNTDLGTTNLEGTIMGNTK